MLSQRVRYSFAILAGVIILTAICSAKTMVTKQSFGRTPEGTAVDLYSLKDGKIEVGIMTYGGIVVSLRAPDRNAGTCHGVDR